MAKLKVHVDAKGRLVLPSEAAKAYGLKPGAQAFIDTGENRLILKAPASHLAKVYIEPTNACNLECRTCIRNDWQETTGFMTSGTFDQIVEGLRRPSRRRLWSFSAASGSRSSTPALWRW